MKKAIIFLLSMLTLIPYSMAYVLAHLLKMKDRQDMQTIKEWITLYRQVDEDDDED